MQNEKLKILQMLEKGQITSAQAADLLKAVDTPAAAPVAPHAQAAAVPPAPTVPPVAPAPHIPPPPMPNSNGPAPTGHGTHHHTGHNAGHPHPGHVNIDDLGRKFESFARDMAPKVQKFTESAVGAIVGAADKLSTAFATPPSAPTSHGRPPQAYGQQTSRPTPRPTTPAPAGSNVVNIEKLVTPDSYNQLNLSGMNGDVRIKGYNGDKITATLTYRAKRHGAPIELVQLGGKYFLNYEAEDFVNVSIDAYVPERAFNIITVDGLNGAVDCQSLTARELRFINANGSMNIAGVAADNLVIENSNGPLTISHSTARTSAIENTNGLINTSETDIENLKLLTFNAPVSVIMSSFNNYNDYLWAIETGNAKLTINLPTTATLGYHIKAHASMGDIGVGLTGLAYATNSPSLVEAKSSIFDTAPKKMKLVAETSNGPLRIH